LKQRRKIPGSLPDCDFSGRQPGETRLDFTHRRIVAQYEGGKLLMGFRVHRLYFDGCAAAVKRCEQQYGGDRVQRRRHGFHTGNGGAHPDRTAAGMRGQLTELVFQPGAQLRDQPGLLIRRHVHCVPGAPLDFRDHDARRVDRDRGTRHGHALVIRMGQRAIGAQESAVRGGHIGGAAGDGQDNGEHGNVLKNFQHSFISK
jgi:hypothetical protein